MPNPWDNDPIVSSGPVYGVPRLPSPQTAPQAQKDRLDVIKTQQDIADEPVTREGKVVNIQQSKKSIENIDFGNVNTLRTGFNSLPEVKNYSEALSALGGMIKAPKGPQGDLAVIYGFAKAMDPGSVVRESEMGMAQSTASVVQQLQQKYKTFLEGKGLPEEVRTGLIESARQKVSGLKPLYEQQYNRYAEQARKNNFDPKAVVGDPLPLAIRPLEEEYIRQHGGTPKIGGVPVDATPQTVGEGDIGFNKPREDPNPYTPEQVAAYDAFVKANPQATREQFTSFLQSVNIQATPESVDRTLEAMHKGGRFDPSLSTLGNARYNTDITDVRGAGVGDDQINAAARGAGDVATFGTLDKLRAGIATIRDGGTFDQNLAREYAISDYDAEKHPYARLAGQAIGGFAVPMGEIRTVPQLVAKGMGLGAAYATGSSRSLADVPQNALLGAVSGAAVPAALVGAGRGIGAIRGAIGRTPVEVPPLVDPATGELNQVMDAMRPAQRMQAINQAGINTVTPGLVGGRSARVIEQGLNNVPGSAGVMEDVNSQISKEARSAMQGVAQRFGTSKTLNEGGSELQRGAKEWMTRFDGVTSKAYNAIPISPQAPTNLNNTLATLQQLSSKLESNPLLQEEIKDPVLGNYLIALQEKGLNWNDLKDFRTLIGSKIGQFRLTEDARTGDYRSLYAALSEDMRSSAAAQGPRALRAFDRANTLYAQGQQRIDQALLRILGPDTQGAPEKAAAAVQAMTRGGKSTGDLRTLAQVKASTVKSGAWDEIASTLIHLGGQPANSEGRAFNPQTFVNWYADMAEPARRMLFKPDQRKALDGFVGVAQQLQRVRGLTNTSNTTPTMIGSGVVSASGILAIANPLALLIPVGGGAANWGMAKLWTSPLALRILTGYTRAAAKGDAGGVKSQIGRLTKLATTNPELRAPIQAMLAHLNDNAPQAGAVAASPDQGPQNQIQPQ